MEECSIKVPEDGSTHGRMLQTLMGESPISRAEDHPEHDVLFIATQVARAAGLKDPAGAVNNAKRNHEAGLTLGTLMANHAISPLPKDTKWIRAKDALGDKLSSMKPDGI